MQAMIQMKYGAPDVLRLAEIERPTPKGDELLVKVKAAGLNAYDWHMMRGNPKFMRLMGVGLLRPKNATLGADVAGVVEAIGNEGTEFNVGDEVYGDLASYGGGGCADYVCTSEKAFAHKPANATFEQAAAVPMAAFTALQGLRDKGKIASGQRVAINGASGGVGTFAVQIAKSYGTEVTAICSSRNVDQARQLGADHVIDYAQEDFTQNGQRYDLIFAANGYHPIADYKRALTPNGTYVCAGGTGKQLIEAITRGWWHSKKGGRSMSMVSTKASVADLKFLTGLIDGGKVTPAIDRRFHLRDLPDAMRYLEEGHARGKIVITLDDTAAP